jgi:hypothetical protein
MDIWSNLDMNAEKAPLMTRFHETPPWGTFPKDSRAYRKGIVKLELNVSESPFQQTAGQLAIE